MSSETRVVRPFIGVDRLERALTSMQLFVGQDGYDTGASVVLPFESFMMRPVDVVLAPDEVGFKSMVEQLVSGVEELDLPVDAVELTVVASSKYLKLVDVIARIGVPLLAEAGRVVHLTRDDRPRSLTTPHGGYSLDVFVALSRALAPEPLKPWRKGTWLARERFSVGTDLGTVGFVPRPLTEDAKLERGLPIGTVRFINLVDESPLLPDVSDDAVELFVDSDLLAQMSASPRSATSRALQLQLFIDAVEEVLAAADRAGDEFTQLGSVADIDGSLLQRVLAMVAGKRQGESEADFVERENTMLQMARSSRARFMAHVEDVCKVRAEFLEAVGE